ncbi:MAG: hypothetical protein PVH91_09110 [Pseudomonadales bacterium]|jgi:hypothetical protein
MKFPSEKWFEAVRQAYNSDSSLHSGGGGACHTRAGFAIGGDHYLIEFDGLECAQVKLTDLADLEDADFIIRMPMDLWVDMISNIQTNGKADLEHTLNSLDLSETDGIAYSPVDDQYRQDLFYRYNQNFQDFFDASSRVSTSF